jgi:hypothetical protein
LLRKPSADLISFQRGQVDVHEDQIGIVPREQRLRVEKRIGRVDLETGVFEEGTEPFQHTGVVVEKENFAFHSSPAARRRT